MNKPSVADAVLSAARAHLRNKFLACFSLLQLAPLECVLQPLFDALERENPAVFGAAPHALRHP